jgi:hypothetical protein
MFAARQAFSQASRRTFSSSSRQVCAPRTELLLISLCYVAMIAIEASNRGHANMIIGVEGDCPRCCRWYRTAVVAASEAQPQSYQALSLRYPPGSRYVQISRDITQNPNVSLQVSLPISATSTPRARYDAIAEVALEPPADTHKVIGHEATPSGLAEALKGADIVVIPAGVPRKPGMTRDGRRR